MAIPPVACAASQRQQTAMPVGPARQVVKIRVSRQPGNPLPQVAIPAHCAGDILIKVGPEYIQCNMNIIKYII